MQKNMLYVKIKTCQKKAVYTYFSFSDDNDTLEYVLWEEKKTNM